mmetsp:Transcript_37278/g.87734  ORF Transcript_37278/g.87734 Transcript_37278/m.87734 type:complete len:304 (-) Transcript_37278:96-1007(-)
MDVGCDLRQRLVHLVVVGGLVAEELCEALVLAPRCVQRRLVPEEVGAGADGFAGRLLLLAAQLVVVLLRAQPLHVRLRRLSALLEQPRARLDLVKLLLLLLLLRACPRRNRLATLQLLLRLAEDLDVACLRCVLHVMASLEHLHLPVVQSDVVITVDLRHFVQLPALLPGRVVLLPQLLPQSPQVVGDLRHLSKEFRRLLAGLVGKHRLSIHLRAGGGPQFACLLLLQIARTVRLLISGSSQPGQLAQPLIVCLLSGFLCHVRSTQVMARKQFLRLRMILCDHDHRQSNGHDKSNAASNPKCV